MWDDHVIVVPVEAYHNFDLWKIFTGPANGLEYLPIRDLTLALDMQIWGDNPFGFHLTNLLLYLLSLPIIYFTTRELTQACGERREQIIAFFTTTIFALHPLHAEPINFVTGRNNILAMLFASAALWLCLRGLRRTPVLCWLSIALFGLGLLSKASVVFLPLFLAVAIALLPGLHRHPKRAWLTLLGFVLLDALAIVGHLVTARQSNVLNEETWFFGNNSLQWGILKAVQIPYFYLGKFIFPYPLSIQYPSHLLEGNALLRASLAAGALTLTLGLLWLIARRKSPFLLISFLWYLLALGPVSNLIPNVPVVADRYAYPAILGLALISAWILSRFSITHLRYTVAIAIAASWIFLDFQRSLDWHTDITLFASAYASYPEKSAIKYAKALEANGQLTKAIEVMRETKPENYYLAVLRGNVALRDGDPRLAAKYFEEAKIRGGRGEREVLISLAAARERSGRYRDALNEYLAAADATSIDPLGIHQRTAEAGIARLRERLRPEQNRLEAQARANPKNPRAQSDLAIFFYESGEYEASVRSYKRAIELAPGPWALWYNLGLSFAKLREYDQALSAYGQALARHPNDPTVLNHQGLAYARSDREEKAIESYQLVLQSDPQHVNAAFNLGRLYFRRGDREGARHFLGLARDLAKDDPNLRAQIEFALKQVP